MNDQAVYRDFPPEGLVDRGGKGTRMDIERAIAATGRRSEAAAERKKRSLSHSPFRVLLPPLPVNHVGGRDT